LKPNLKTPNPAVAPARGLKKVSFGAIKPKKESTKSAYPILPDPTGEIYKLAKLIKQQSQELEALGGAFEANKAELKRLTLPGYFKLDQGKTEVPSSIAVSTTEGEVLVTFQNRYKKMADEAPLYSLLGKELVAAHFKQAFTITISGEQLATVDPADADRCPAQEFVDAFKLVARPNANEAVTCKQEIKPTKEFHDRRHRLLTLEQNIALDAICTIVAVIKNKVRVMIDTIAKLNVYEL
jgi:hypothetical protein